MGSRIYINTPTNGDKDIVSRRIETLKKRIMERGDIAVSPLTTGIGRKTIGKHIGDDVACVVDECDGILLDLGWKNNEVCMVVYHAAAQFKKIIYHTKEEYENICNKYVI